MILERIDAYLIKVFGFKMATQLKTDCAKKSDLIKVILLKELNRTYKYADAVTIIRINTIGLLSVRLQRQGLR
jgi:hypothetical protein